MSVHTADVKSVLRAYSIEVSASTAADLQEVSFLNSTHRLGSRAWWDDSKLTWQDDIVQRLRRAGGANYDRSKFD